MYNITVETVYNKTEERAADFVIISSILKYFELQDILKSLIYLKLRYYWIRSRQ